jgi:hypothetical protein
MERRLHSILRIEGFQGYGWYSGFQSACLYLLQRVLQWRAAVRQRHQDVPQRELAAPTSRQDVVCNDASVFRGFAKKDELHMPLTGVC